METCSKCGKEDFIIYPYRGKNYCHECFIPIKEAVDEAEKKYARPPKGDDFVFFPGIDQETRLVMFDWVMANGFITIEKPEWAYAWLKVHRVHPDLTDAWRKACGEPLLTPQERAGWTKNELQGWDKAVQEYLKWKAKRIASV